MVWYLLKGKILSKESTPSQQRLWKMRGAHVSGERHILEPWQVFSSSHCCSSSARKASPEREICHPAGTASPHTRREFNRQSQGWLCPGRRRKVARIPPGLGAPRIDHVPPAEEVLGHQQLSQAPNLCSGVELFLQSVLAAQDSW